MTGNFRSKSDYNIGLVNILMGRDGQKEDWLIAELRDLVRLGQSDAEITDHLTSRGAVTSDAIAAGIGRARSLVTFEDASAALAAGQRDAPVLPESYKSADSQHKRSRSQGLVVIVENRHSGAVSRCLANASRPLGVAPRFLRFAPRPQRIARRSLRYAPRRLQPARCAVENAGRGKGRAIRRMRKASRSL